MVISLDGCWALARAWYPAARLEAAWRGRDAETAEGIFASLDLSGPFWRMS